MIKVIICSVVCIIVIITLLAILWYSGVIAKQLSPAQSDGSFDPSNLYYRGVNGWLLLNGTSTVQYSGIPGAPFFTGQPLSVAINGKWQGTNINVQKIISISMSGSSATVQLAMGSSSGEQLSLITGTVDISSGYPVLTLASS